MEFMQIKRAKEALIALRDIYGEESEGELLSRFLTDLRLLASEGYMPLDIRECVRESHKRWRIEHPLKRPYIYDLGE